MPHAPAPDDRAFRDEIVGVNLRRLQALLPIMTGLHVAHAVVFHLAGERETDPAFRAWRLAVERVHEVTLVGVVPLAIAAFVTLRTGHRLGRLVPPATYALYLLHAACVVGADQLAMTSVTPYIGYALGAVIVLCLDPRVQLPISAMGLATFLASVWTMQPDREAVGGILPNGVTVTIVAGALSWFLWAGRRRDFDQRALIERQRGELEALNRDLERRVSQQVAEIVTRAREVESLNAQLQAQVTARSVELTKALATLEQRNPSGAEDKVLGGRFELGRRLGAGGMGEVFEAIDHAAGTVVAIKRIHARSAAELDALHRFLREARSTAAVAHPAVVRVLHVDLADDGSLYQVLERIEGESLSALLPRVGRLRAPAVARLGAVLCDALAAAHAQGVVHRDVKPGNVMITPAPPGLKLLDFGIARLYEDAAVASHHTATGLVIGTPAYMGPEQLEAARDLTDRVDVYAVGVTLFQCLAGRFPFDDTSFRGMARNHARPAPDVRTFVVDVPEPLAVLIARCLERRAEHRPSAREASDAFAAFASTVEPRSLDALVRESAIVATPSDAHTLALEGR